MNPEEKKEYMKRWREAHREQRQEAMKRWYQSHRDQHLEATKQWYQAHRDQHLEATKQWHQAHKNQHQEANKRWHQAHKDQELKRAKQYRESLKRNIVYQYIDLSDNTLAYVGSTNNPYMRLKIRLDKNTHVPFDRLYQEDPSRFRFEELQEFDTIEEARVYEKELIQTMHPKYNVVFNVKSK